MDPRDRADAALARARARGAYVVTPEDAVSPMDASNTVQIPRALVKAADTNHDESDSTMVISAEMARGQAPRQQGGQHGDGGGQYEGRQPGHQSGQHQPVHPQSVAGQQFSGDSQQAHPQSNQQQNQHQQGQQQPGQQLQQGQPGQSWGVAPRQPAEPDEPPVARELGGLVPTVHQPGTQRSALSRRLDGQ